MSHTIPIIPIEDEQLFVNAEDLPEITVPPPPFVEWNKPFFIAS